MESFLPALMLVLLALVFLTSGRKEQSVETWDDN